jgi:hypothetical protein
LEVESAAERDREELQVLQERTKEIELAGVRPVESTSSLVGDTTLDAELSGDLSPEESRTE